MQKKTKDRPTDQKINPERYFSRILFVCRFSQTEKILFTSMRTQTGCQIDFYCSRLYRQIPTDRFYCRLSLFKIEFYCSRFYRQINLSSLHLTQVTFEDLPWFTSSINRQTSKTEGGRKIEIQVLDRKIEIQVLVSFPRSNPQKDF